MLFYPFASLGAAVLIADRKLRRFRLLSDIIRRIRFYFFGYCYTAADMEAVIELEGAEEFAAFLANAANTLGTPLLS